VVEAPKGLASIQLETSTESLRHGIALNIWTGTHLIVRILIYSI
jgi:hypothetical protein